MCHHRTIIISKVTKKRQAEKGKLSANEKYWQGNCWTDLPTFLRKRLSSVVNWEIKVLSSCRFVIHEFKFVNDSVALSIRRITRLSAWCCQLQINGKGRFYFNIITAFCRRIVGWERRGRGSGCQPRLSADVISSCRFLTVGCRLLALVFSCWLSAVGVGCRLLVLFIGCIC